MSNEPNLDRHADDRAADQATAVRRDLEARMPDDPTGVERAFGNAVRAAWVLGEPWAVDWVEQAAFGHPDSQ